MVYTRCVNRSLNQDYQQLNSNLIASNIQGMIKTQFTLLMATFKKVLWRNLDTKYQDVLQFLKHFLVLCEK